MSKIRLSRMLSDISAGKIVPEDLESGTPWADALSRYEGHTRKSQDDDGPLAKAVFTLATSAATIPDRRTPQDEANVRMLAALCTLQSEYERRPGRTHEEIYLIGDMKLHPMM